jgi:hypothetical protein
MTATVAPRPVTARLARWLAVGLLAVTAAIHLALFPSHAGLVDEAAAHPKPKPQPTATTQAPAPPEPIRLGRGRPEPPMATPAPASTPEPYMSPPYVGWLFLLGGAVALVAARHVLADRLAGWGLGAAVCAAMTVGLLAARTVGLPGGYSEGGSVEGDLSLAVQTGFLALFAYRLRGTRPGLRAA